MREREREREKGDYNQSINSNKIQTMEKKLFFLFLGLFSLNICPINFNFNNLLFQSMKHIVKE